MNSGPEGIKSAEELEAAEVFNKQQQKQRENATKTSSELGSEELDAHSSTIKLSENYNSAENQYYSRKDDKNFGELRRKKDEAESKLMNVSLDQLANSAEKFAKEMEQPLAELESTNSNVENFVNKYQNVTSIKNFQETASLVVEGFSALDNLSTKYDLVREKNMVLGNLRFIAMQKLFALKEKSLNNSDSKNFNEQISQLNERSSQLKEKLDKTNKARELMQKSSYLGESAGKILGKIEYEAQWNALFNWLLGKPEVKDGEEIPPQMFDWDYYKKIRGKAVSENQISKLVSQFGISI